VIIASAQITAAVRAVPDVTAAPGTSDAAGTTTHPSFRSVLHQYHSSEDHSAQDEGNSHSNSQSSKQKDKDATRTVDLTRPAVPVAVAVTAANRDAKLAEELVADTKAPDSDSAEPSSQEGASAHAAGHSALRQYSVLKGDPKGDGLASQPEQKNSDSNQAAATPAPVTQGTEQPRAILPLTSSITLRQDGNSVQNGSTAQARKADPGSDPEIQKAPELDADDAAAPSADPLAFAARLSPSTGTPPKVTTTDAPSVAAADPQGSRPQAQLSNQLQVAAKQAASGSDVQSDSRSGQGADSSSKEKAPDIFAKPETPVLQTHAIVADHAPASTAVPPANAAPASPLSPAASLGKVIDPPAAPATNSHDITIRIPDATEQGTAVRFVDRGGEVHVSVRTADTDMAQTLRGGLNDLVNRLEDGGIRTEVWQPGSGASTSQNDSHHPFADADGSNGRQNSSGSNSEQESRQQNKPRWVEEFEGSIGNSDFKETQILWQV